MNAVESLLTRLQISDAIPAFRGMQVEKIVQLRALAEDKLREAVPDEEQRRTLINAINNRGNPVGPNPINDNPPRYNDEERNFDGPRGRGGRGGRGRGGYSRQDGSSEGPKRSCRQFFTPEGCKFGDNCKYVHDSEIYKRESEGTQTRSNDNIGRDSYSEVVNVPTDAIKFLLGDKAARLRHINEICGTTNSKIEKPPNFSETYPIAFFGTPESVGRAKAELLKAVGFKSQDDKRARFEYANNELAHNIRSVNLLAAINARRETDGNALSEAVLKRVAETFRFDVPQKVRHFFVNCSQADKEKFEFVSKITSQLKGIQAIVFTEPQRVVEMSKAPGPQKISRAFNNVKPLFLHRELTKVERMEALEAFKNGEENEHGVKQRLLVTTADYAKLARKTLIPYVNFIANFSMPRTMEFFLLQSLCAGRHGTQGTSITFVTPHDQPVHKEWTQTIPFEEFRDEKSFATTASQLVYDTKANSLTTEAADPPTNWRELIEKEAAEKAAKKAAKTA
jgi:hypothetical protein